MNWATIADHYQAPEGTIYSLAKIGIKQIETYCIMCETREKWKAYLDSADRKVKIAKHHLEHLEQELLASKDCGGKLPSIGVQAHFEGVVISVVAAIDQVAQSANDALKLQLVTSKLVSGGFAYLSEKIPEVKIWYSNPLGIDLRRIRTRIVHYSYEKKPSHMVWIVELGTTNYSGSRELTPYANAALEYGLELTGLFPKIRGLYSGKLPYPESM